MNREEVVAYVKNKLDKGIRQFYNGIAIAVFDWYSSNPKYFVEYHNGEKYYNPNKIGLLREEKYNSLEDFFMEITGDFDGLGDFENYKGVVLRMLDRYAHGIIADCYEELVKICPSTIEEITDTELNRKSEEDNIFDFFFEMLDELELINYIDVLEKMDFKEVLEKGRILKLKENR